MKRILALVSLAIAQVLILAGCATPAERDVNALTVKEECLGEPLQTMRRSGDFLIPKANTDGWWFVTSYNPVSRNKMPIQIYIVDLDTGKVSVKKQMPSGALAQTIENKGIKGKDGRFYIGHYAKAGIWRFDQGNGGIEWFAFPDIVERVVPFCARIAENDGKIYVGTASCKSYLYEFDPETKKFRNFGIQGRELPAPRYIWTMAIADDFVYSGCGKNPWILVATDRKTGKQTTLLDGNVDYLKVGGSGDNCSAAVTTKDPKTQKSVIVRYRLKNGKMVPSVPTSASAPAPKKRKRIKPELQLTLARPNSKGEAQVWWRSPGKPWQHADLKNVQTTPWRICNIRTMPDGRIFGIPKAYEDCFIYDPDTNKFSILGKAPLSASQVECIDGKVYVMGYPGTYMVEYDPGRPWTFYTSTPDYREPALTSEESNPRECFRMSSKIMPTHHVHGSALGADGRIYLGAHAERLHVGGGLGWWNPKTRKFGGVRKPFEVQDCSDIVAADGGKLIIYSSRPVRDPSGKLPRPKEARLFIYDTDAKKVTGEIPLAGYVDGGHIAAAGSRVFGFGKMKGKKGSVFYVVDLKQKKVLHQNDLMEALGSNLRIGPDGNIYGFLDNNLFRLNPNDFTITRVATVSKPGNLDFRGNDLYWCAGAKLMRIKDVAKP